MLELLLKSFELISSFDQDLYEIIFLSLKVSFIALLVSSIIGLPICAVIATNDFIGKKILIIFFNSMMALPPVFVGLVLYILFSKSGPLGFLEILYTPLIMIIAQIVLILPIIISVGIETLENIAREYDELLSILNVNLGNKIKIILWDGRFVLFTCILTGLGRALSEVGAIIIVGGNIIHVTRVMTTSIALETSKGNLTLAMSLGIILIIISIVLNGFALITKYSAKRFSYD
ncbi:MAG: ABC transporter permease [Rickettsiales bacterium]|nr:ABC transporter permease [Rickettsiales bacterium]